MGRRFTRFTYKQAAYRVSTPALAPIRRSVIESRNLLDDYGSTHPRFLTSLKPLPDDREAPSIARTMIAAARSCDVGPMAAVAGAIASEAVGCAYAEGFGDAIVENGGDLSIFCSLPVLVAIEYMVEKSSQLAFRITPDLTPLAVCSSSSRMGHSYSAGDCDLVTVAARDGALADAAATKACNEVRAVDDIERVLSETVAIPGVDGLLIAKDGMIGLAGNLPEIVRHVDPDIAVKITRS